MFDAVNLDLVNTGVGLGSLGLTVLTIMLSRRPSTTTLPPEMPIEARSQYLMRHSESWTSAELPAEIQERIFLAEDTPGTTEDDIAAREAGIAFLEGQLAKADTAKERMPIRLRLRELRSEIAQLRRGRKPSIRRLSSLFDPAWSLMYKLPALRGRKRPWLAAVIGFVLGGIGLSVYFRRLVDVLVLVTLVIASFLVGTVVEAGSWWVGAAIASFYGFIRAESSNRRLALRDVSAPTLSPGSGAIQSAS